MNDSSPAEKKPGFLNGLAPSVVADVPVIPARAANDTLYRDLELRYGGGFAQWVTDRISPGEDA